MLIKIGIFFLVIIGIFLISGMSLPSFNIKNSVVSSAKKLQALRPKRATTAKDFINEINGTAKESFTVRSKKEAASVFEKTGQQEKYRQTLRLSLIAACAGAAIGLIMKNILLSVVLGFGFYYLPLWLTQFYLFSYNKFVGEELEVALSLITTSYTRSNDLVSAIRENISHINYPVKDVFISFANNIQYVDSNAAAQIEKMKMSLDNKLFHEWCDSLILCQSDHTLRATLIPIVNKFSDLKTQQQENETNMMLPLRRAQFMTLLVVGCIPGLYLVNKIWFDNLVGTSIGQIVLTVTAVAVFMMMNKAIKLSRPVEYDL